MDIYAYWHHTSNQLGGAESAPPFCHLFAKHNI